MNDNRIEENEFSKIPQNINFDLIWKAQQKEIQRVWLHFFGFSFFFLLTHPPTFLIMMSISLLSAIYIFLYYWKKPLLKTYFITQVIYKVILKNKTTAGLTRINEDIEKQILQYEGAELEVIDLVTLEKKKISSMNFRQNYIPGLLIQLLVSQRNSKMLAIQTNDNKFIFEGILPLIGKLTHYKTLKQLSINQDIDAIHDPRQVFNILIRLYVFGDNNSDQLWKKWIQNKIFSPDNQQIAFCKNCEKRPILNAMGVFQWCQCPSCGGDEKLIRIEKIIGFLGEAPTNLPQYHFVNINYQPKVVECIWCWKNDKLDENISKYLLNCQNSDIEIANIWHFSSFDPPQENTIRMIKEIKPTVEFIYGFK